MRRVLHIALFLLSAAALHAQILVAFTEGSPVVATDDGRFIETGDLLEPDAVIRLRRGDFVELQIQDRTVRLSREGEYALATLARVARTYERSGAATSLSGRVSRVLGRSHEIPQTAAMGVRGPGEQVPEIAMAMDLMAEGEHEEARNLLVDVAKTLQDRSLLPLVAYLAGTAAAQIGDTQDALDWLDLVGPDPRTEFFVDHSILLAHLLYESYAFADSAVVLEDLIVLEPRLSADPDVTLLLALALSDGGDPDAGRKLLESLVDSVHDETARALLSEAVE